jgi:hypothetical protein
MRIRRLDSNGDRLFGHSRGDFLDGAAAVVQAIQTRLRLVKGDWFLDTTEGVAWMRQTQGQNILGDRFDRASTEAELKACILGAPGVATMTAFSLVLDHDTRRATVRTTITTDFGAPATVEVSLP